MHGRPVIGRKVRFAIVGCGHIAKSHISAIKENSDRAELVDLCDVDPLALDSAVQITGAAGHRDLTSLLRCTKADCIVLTTPSGLHPAQTIEAATAGCHVITEKPMATRWLDALEMVKVCDDTGVQLIVVKQQRYNPILQAVKQAIEQGRFGSIYSVAVNLFYSRPQSYYDSATWRGTPALDGGALMNQASHYVDLLHWLVGPVESVMTYVGTLGRKIQVEDTAVSILRWRTGALGTVNVTVLAYPKNVEASVTVLGETGTVTVGGVSAHQVERWQFADARPEDALVSAVSRESVTLNVGHGPFYDNVLRALRGEAAPQTDGREGLKTVELLTAMYLSAEQGRRISLPLELSA
jgi:UDP-N-acetyl-2-amino-2-deoxyglucuronate dehydrogenase